MKIPLYKEIYNNLKKEIYNDVYKPGDKLPSDSELANKFNVSKITITSAMNQLKEDGLISRAPKRGTYVLERNKKLKERNPKRKTKIGLLVPNFNDLFGSEFLQTFIALAQKKYQISFHLSNSDQALENKLIEDFLLEDIEGLVLIPSFSDTVSPTILKLISQNFPIIVVDRSLSDLPVCSVMTNNQKSAEALTNVLLQSGHLNIAMITTKMPLSSISERTEGFIKAHMHAAMPLGKDCIFYLGYKKELNIHIREIKNFLVCHPKITGVVCEEYYIAYCVKEAMRELNITAPNDLSVVCFDYPTMFYQNPPQFLTHIKQNEKELAEETFKMLNYKFSNKNDFKKILVDGQLIFGSSVRQIK